jgi:hypothetical protein
MPRARSSSKNSSTANFGFEAKLWLAADKFYFRISHFDFASGSDTAPRGSATLQNRTNPQVVREAQDNFRKDDDVRWQWREATWTTTGSPKGEHNLAHQYGSLSRGNANFALPSLPHSAFRIPTSNFEMPRAPRHGRLRPRPFLVLGKIESCARAQAVR